MFGSMGKNFQGLRVCFFMDLKVTSKKMHQKRLNHTTDVVVFQSWNLDVAVFWLWNLDVAVFWSWDLDVVVYVSPRPGFRFHCENRKNQAKLFQ